MYWEWEKRRISRDFSKSCACSCKRSGGDAVDGQGLQKQGQELGDAKEGGARDEAQVEGQNDVFEQHIGQVLQAEGQPQGIEFALVVRPVHARDIHRDVALVVDVFDDLQSRRASE